jgi:hypothetical protein
MISAASKLQAAVVDKKTLFEKATSLSVSKVGWGGVGWGGVGGGGGEVAMAAS